MCGIVGYVGPKDSVPVLVGGLERLEYRGYDSAGVATISSDSFQVYRAEGKLKNLKQVLSETRSDPKLSSLNVGIGHTRWATHGRPSEINAHPHVAGDVCVVHNGIIENYVELRKRLQAEGCEFKSETDTEIAAHLINGSLKESPFSYSGDSRCREGTRGKLRSCCYVVEGSRPYRRYQKRDADCSWSG